MGSVSYRALDATPITSIEPVKLMYEGNVPYALLLALSVRRDVHIPRCGYLLITGHMV